MIDERPGLHIGVDLGGTKIAGVLLDAQQRQIAHCRVATPQGDYQGIVAAVTHLVAELESASSVALTERARAIPVGVGTPGVRVPGTGLMTSCNSVCLNGKPLREDLAAALGRPVQLANDADCMALSEWSHYQAAYADTSDSIGTTLFGVILGDPDNIGLATAIAEKSMHCVTKCIDFLIQIANASGGVIHPTKMLFKLGDTADKCRYADCAALHLPNESGNGG